MTSPIARLHPAFRILLLGSGYHYSRLEPAGRKVAGDVNWNRGCSMKLAVASVAMIAALALSPRVGLAQAPDGAALYKANCAACHGATGVPAAAMAKMFKNLKPFTDPATLQGIPQDSVVSIVEHGIAPGMKSFKGKLSEEQAGAIAKYVKGLAKQG